MSVPEPHAWDVDPDTARRIQREWAKRVVLRDDTANVKTIAGVDISVPRFADSGRAAIVALSWPTLEIVATARYEGPIPMPYIPGLLAFREIPLILGALAQLDPTPDLLMLDGQGYAHPRRFGIACHLGVLIDKPTIGCAKSILTGHLAPLDEAAGARADLIAPNGEVIGAGLRLKVRTNPVIVSPGHRVDQAAAERWVWATARGYRLPEPTRLAHNLAGGKLTPPASGQPALQPRLFGE